MLETDEKINSGCTVFEPTQNQISYCEICDVEISTYDAPEGLCAICLEGAR